MNLNHIELPAAAIAELYRSSLVVPGDNSPGENLVSDELAQVKSVTAETPGQKGWISLGNNRKKILLIVDHKEVLHLPEEELGLLTGILTACKLEMDDVSLLNLHNYPEADYKQLVLHFKCKTVLLIGVEPLRLGLLMNFPPFQQQSFANTTYLFSPALIELGNDKLLKSKLWVCLKRLFGV